VDFISDFSPRYQRELRELRSIPYFGRAAKAAQRIIYKYRYKEAPREGGAWVRMRRAPLGF
jgi:hypothetical protein